MHPKQCERQGRSINNSAVRMTTGQCKCLTAVKTLYQSCVTGKVTDKIIS